MERRTDGARGTTRRAGSLFRRLLCLLLALSFFTVSGASGEEETKEPEPEDKSIPWLVMEVSAIHAEEDGSVDIVAELSAGHAEGTEVPDKIKDVKVTAEGTNGLKVQYFLDPVQDRVYGDTLELGDLTSVHKFSIHCQYDDPEDTGKPPEETPEIRIRASSRNLQGVFYTAPVDVQPRARVILWYMTKVSFGSDIARTAQAIERAYAGKTYAGKPVQSAHIIDAKDALGEEDGWGSLEGFEPDANDITYIYIGSHGMMDEEYRPIPYVEMNDPSADNEYHSTTLLSVDRILEAIRDKVKGRVVILFDFCFSGMALESEAISGLDPKKTFIVTATTSQYTSGSTGNDKNSKTKFGALLDRVLERYEGECATGRDLVAESKSFSTRLDQFVSHLLNLLGFSAAFASAGPGDQLDVLLSKLLPDSTMKDRQWIRSTLKRASQSRVLEILKKQLGTTASIEAGWTHFLRTLGYEPDPDTLLTDADQQWEFFFNKTVTALWGEDIAEDDYFHLHIWTQFLRSPMGINIPQFYGNEDLPLFFRGDYDDGCRTPALLKDKEKYEWFPPEADFPHGEIPLSDYYGGMVTGLYREPVAFFSSEGGDRVAVVRDYEDPEHDLLIFLPAEVAEKWVTDPATDRDTIREWAGRYPHTYITHEPAYFADGEYLYQDTTVYRGMHEYDSRKVMWITGPDGGKTVAVFDKYSPYMGVGMAPTSVWFYAVDDGSTELREIFPDVPLAVPPGRSADPDAANYINTDAVSAMEVVFDEPSGLWCFGAWQWGWDRQYGKGATDSRAALTLFTAEDGKLIPVARFENGEEYERNLPEKPEGQP